MSKRTVIIAGAGIAGLSVAYWLSKAGWQVTLIERADDLRGGSYMMGLSGPGLRVATKMGLRKRLESRAFEIDENVYLDRHGKEIVRLRYRDFLGNLPFIALRRSDLVATLYDALPEVEIVFGQTIEKVGQTSEQVNVTLSNEERRDADLLLGGDGVRSTLRSMLFGPSETEYEPLGYRFATMDVEDRLSLGTGFLSFSSPGLMAEFYTLTDGKIAALYIWRSEETGTVPAAERLLMLKCQFAASHPTVLRLLDQAEEENAPIVMDDMMMVTAAPWSKGRVAVIGDAAHALTLVSGQGAGMAMTGAAILAEELASEKPLPEALAAYELRLRPVIEKLQDRSRKTAKFFVPASTAGFQIRNLIMKFIPRRLLGYYFARSIKSEILLSRSDLV